MKKTFFFIILLVCIKTPAQTQTKTEIKKNLLEGLWLFRAQRTSNALDKGFIPTTPGTFKMVASDGKFTNFSINGYNAMIGTDGYGHIESDSIYVESVQRSIIPSLVGKDNRLVYKLKNNNLYLKFFLEKNTIDQDVNIWIEEIWEKIEMPKANPYLIR